MNKSVLLSLLFIISFLKVTYSQDNFTINIVDAEEEISSVKLSFVLDSSYYKNNLSKLKEMNFEPGNFVSGEIENPYLCEFIIDGVNYSKPFMIYPGQNNLRIVKVKNTFVVLNDKDKEGVNEFSFLASLYPNSYDIYQYLSKSKGQFATEKDSLLLDSYSRTDSILYNYNKLYPKSYFGLWFIARLMRFGYNNIHGDAFSNLSDDLKASYLGKVVGGQVENYKKVSNGQIIPNASFEDSDSKKIDLLDAAKNKSITLLSFWYHNCGPCISKFPDLISLHRNYSEKFQVIGISTDSRGNRDKWLSTIEKNNLPWTNLIDVEQHAFENFRVQVFPFSFLINSSGEIIKINPSIVELKNYLDGTL